MVTGLTQRMASLQDLKEIWGLVRQVAPSIPVDLESNLTQENILTELMACCTSGLSPVAVDKDKAIVGAVLARRDDFDWGFLNGKAVHISYAAIAPDHSGNGTFAALVGEVQGRNVPVLASVKNGNQSGLVEELKKLGFEHQCTAASGWGDLYKWQPAPSPPE